ncbi:PREDICTED: coiled-coil domain-containing protein 7 [Dipodomys ordii]|uniref:Coiled-coil domain-containing protein 7 n=1 Tax=Dipodomys ordii TaxID=10020 RepID=A0A1S3EL68_DIPOR|nr:PREDICTED: coiled-coil domain-containing protein 7 [Dipodomys ordii]
MIRGACPAVSCCNGGPWAQRVQNGTSGTSPKIVAAPVGSENIQLEQGVRRAGPHSVSANANFKELSASGGQVVFINNNVSLVNGYGRNFYVEFISYLDNKMKPTKHISTPSHALASAPEVPYMKQLLNLSLSPKARETHGAKLIHHKAEPMVIKSPPTGENSMRYALPIPSIQTKRLIAGDEKIKEIIKHLIVVVSRLEETYGFDFENVKSKKADSKQEDLFNSVGNLKSFMTYCSEFTTQLEQSCKEERSISRDQNFADDLTFDERPALAYSQLGKLIGKLEHLRNYVKHAPKYIQKSIEYENLLAKKKSYESLRQQIEGEY